MLSTVLAAVYGVEPRRMMAAVRRNLERFPVDFMFQLSDQEFARIQTQISSVSVSKNRIPPYAFSEQGIAMLSSILRSPNAIQINIEIMREFVAIRTFVLPSPAQAKKIGIQS